MNNPLSTVDVTVGNGNDASVIWLHGLGADANDFPGIIPELGLPEGTGIRFRFPNAPMRAVTINAGMTMRAWYDILGFDRGTQEDEAGLVASEAQIYQLIENEIARGQRSDRIFLAGFSQGGATAIFSGLRFDQPLGGIISLSAYCPCASTLVSSRHQANQETPIFIGHGRFDDVVKFEWGKETKRRLLGMEYRVEWHEYDLAHSVSFDECRDVGHWLQHQLAATRVIRA